MLATGSPHMSDAATSGLRCRSLSFQTAVLPPRRPGLLRQLRLPQPYSSRIFPGNYNVNISYGWGTFDNAPSAFLTNPGSGVFSLGGGTSFGVTYSQLKGWLTAEAASSAQITAVA
jgi:hypothetical protein